jgi:hypothetical protein
MVAEYRENAWWTFEDMIKQFSAYLADGLDEQILLAALFNDRITTKQYRKYVLSGALMNPASDLVSDDFIPWMSYLSFVKNKSVLKRKTAYKLSDLLYFKIVKNDTERKLGPMFEEFTHRWTLMKTELHYQYRPEGTLQSLYNDGRISAVIMF